MNGLFRGDFPEEIPGRSVGFPFYLTRYVGIRYTGGIIGRGSTWYLGWVGVILLLYKVDTIHSLYQVLEL